MVRQPELLRDIALRTGLRPTWGSFVTTRYGPFLIALTMIAAIMVAGFMLPRSEHLASLMATVPAATATLAGARLTAVIAGVSCVGSLVLDAYDGLLGTSIFAVHLLAIILVSGCVIAFRTLRERNTRELIELRTVAETVQRVLLRPLPPSIGSLRIRSEYHASHPHALVGGDLYAVSSTPDSVRILIGDVKGKGLPAVEDAAALLGAFRSTARKTPSLSQLMATLDEAVQAHFDEISATDPNAAERFITALLLEIPADGSSVRMINCGHPPPFVIEYGKAHSLPSMLPAPPLGLNTRTSDYATTVLPLATGAIVLLYTDGVAEARDTGGNFYELDARIAAWSGCDPGDLLRYVLDGLADHVGGEMRLDDDVALVAVQHHDTECASRRIEQPAHVDGD
ncbi:Phosphoserine phosphatase RsbU [Streptomyces sp. MBT84]|nr:Phosphoserine phosphatase RsbU [Streptomyces sp. MBT84]